MVERQAFRCPEAVHDVGHWALLQIDIPRIECVKGEAVRILQAPTGECHENALWLVGKDRERIAFISTANLKMKVYGFDRVDGQGSTPRSLTPSDMRKSALLLADIPHTYFTAGDLVVVRSPAVVNRHFLVQRYVTHDVTIAHENSLCLIDYLPERFRAQVCGLVL